MISPKTPRPIAQCRTLCSLSNEISSDGVNVLPRRRYLRARCMTAAKPNKTTIPNTSVGLVVWVTCGDGGSSTKCVLLHPANPRIHEPLHEQLLHLSGRRNPSRC